MAKIVGDKIIQSNTMGIGDGVDAILPFNNNTSTGNFNTIVFSVGTIIDYITTITETIYIHGTIGS